MSAMLVKTIAEHHSLPIRGKCKNCRAEVPCQTLTHGTTSSYSYHGCRCVACREFNKLYAVNSYRQRRDVIRAKAKERYAADPQYRATVLAGNRERRSARSDTQIERDRASRAKWRRKARKDPRWTELRNLNAKECRDRKPPHTITDRKREYHREYRERNKFCLQEYRLRRNEKEKSQHAPMKGQPWTTSDEATILRTDLTTAEKSFLLGRTKPSIRSRLYQLNNPEIVHKRKTACNQKRHRLTKTYNHTRSDQKIFSEDEDTIILLAIQNGTPIIETAFALGRPYASVAAKRKRLERNGMPKARQCRRSWTATEDVIAIRNDLTLAEIAAMLNRPYGSVAKRRFKLREKGLLT